MLEQIRRNEKDILELTRELGYKLNSVLHSLDRNTLDNEEDEAASETMTRASGNLNEILDLQESIHYNLTRLSQGLKTLDNLVGPEPEPVCDGHPVNDRPQKVLLKG